MIKTLLATVGLAVVLRCAYQHIVRYQALKQENCALRKRWKACASGKPP